MPLRHSNCEITVLDDECVCYNPVTAEGHHLNPTASLILQHCDGETDRSLVVTKLSEFGDGEQILEVALAELSRNGLVSEESLAEAAGGLSRRAFLGKSLTAVSLPVITTLVLGAPADAISGTGTC